MNGIVQPVGSALVPYFRLKYAADRYMIIIIHIHALKVPARKKISSGRPGPFTLSASASPADTRQRRTRYPYPAVNNFISRTTVRWPRC